MTFGSRLKQIRMQRDMTLRRLAEKTGVSYSLIHSIEKDELIPTREAILSLARALQYDEVDELLELAGHRKNGH